MRAASEMTASAALAEEPTVGQPPGRPCPSGLGGRPGDGNSRIFFRARREGEQIVASERPCGMRDTTIEHTDHPDHGRLYAATVRWGELAVTLGAAVTAIAMTTTGHHDGAAGAVFVVALRRLAELRRAANRR